MKKLFLLLSLIGIFALLVLCQRENYYYGKIEDIRYNSGSVLLKLNNSFSVLIFSSDLINLSKNDFIKVSGKIDNKTISADRIILLK